MRHVVYLYGHRPRERADLWHLPPYEFMVFWTVDLAEYSRDPEYDHADFPAKLTESGKKKFRHRRDGQGPALVSGEDYAIMSP